MSRRAIASVAALAALLIGSFAAPTANADDWADAQAAFDEYDDQRALALLQRAAESCDPRAEEALGLALRFGDRLFPGLPSDPAAARRWLARATGADADRSRCGRDVPAAKRTRLGLYLKAADVPAFIAGSREPVLFFDIRTRAEATYVGMPQAVEGLLPYMEHEDFDGEWDVKRNTFRPQLNSAFAQALAAALAQRGLSRDATIVLICRSGDRSARAADLLAQLGYSRVYSVVDGFEGDLDRDGRRAVNGWKNAGLPWTYQLDRTKVPVRRQ